MKRACILIVAVACSVAVFATPAAAKPPAACVKALDAAEDLDGAHVAFRVATEGYVQLAANTLVTMAPTTGGITAALNAYTGHLRDYTAASGAANELYSTAQAKYEKAAKACRKS